MSQRVVITGANRGIGLELARLYVASGAKVMVGCRSQSPELQSLAESGNLEVHTGMDVRQERSAVEFAQRIQRWRDSAPVDLLINNAGVLHKESLDSLHEVTIDQQFQVNAMGPLRVTKAMLGMIDTGTKIAMITSRMGSLADNQSGAYYGYRMSKAALNAASVSLAHDLKPKGISVGIIHPGYVKTDMTGKLGNVMPSEAAQNIAARIQDLSLENSGQFWHADGQKLPW